MTIEIPVDDGVIIAVPAIHCRSVFARAVRLAFGREASKPSAVAVELSPSAADSLADWIRELSKNVRFGQELPCMLGLIRSNRRIHPKYRSACIRLQEVHGVPLHQIPPRFLRQDLHYAAISLLCLSATEPIIEAVRCAVQYGLDIHGVDLEDFASCERAEVLVEDPIAAMHDFKAYVKRNAAHCAACRDPMIDGRRERAMASRLKGLVHRYGSVLFTGGLAHWTALEQLLRDPEVPAAAVTPLSGDVAYTRVVVDPAVAVHYMDVLPDYTPYYEHVRTLDARDMSAGFDIPHDVHSKLVRAYQSATVDADGHPDSTAQGQFHSFLFYLNNTCLLRHQVVSDLACVLASAAALVSEEFAQRLGRELIAAPQIRWLQPDDMPDIPYLRAVPFVPGEYHLVRNCHKAELVRPDGRHGPFFVDGISGTKSDGAVEIAPYFLKPDTIGGGGDGDGDNMRNPPWVWPPCENLFYGTAYHVAEHAYTQTVRAASEPFTGSLHEGINIKASLRAAARHEERIYVKVASRGSPVSLREALSDPFVYIFQRPQRNRSMDSVHWNLLLAGAVQEHHFRAKEARKLFRSIQQKRGSAFVASVQFCETREPPANLARCSLIEGVRVLWGSVAFGNPCLNILQCARWLEEGDFACCPVLRFQTMSELVRMYNDYHGVSLELNNWPETLIRIAIQQARRRVLVMAPDRSAITQRARMEARKRHVGIDVVPLSFISADRITAIRNQYCVYPVDKGATQWSPTVIELLGPSDAHIDLLPSWIRLQTVENR